ncbi:MAG: hypothetical protein KDK70_01635 [Myxococcales bacterium]|nr:hypothetical protein [Myxococcales bacterium]
MRSRRLLLVVGLGLACSYPNPAYEDSGPVGGSDASQGTSVGGSSEGSTSLPPADGSSTLWGATTTTTMGEASEELGESGPPPSGCDAPPPPPGVVCQQPDPVDLSRECDPRPVFVADLDGDALGDVIVGCDQGPLLVLHGEPGGLGAPQTIGEAGPAPVDIAVAQLDGEHGVDIVVVDDVLGDGVRVFFDEGDGTYTLESYDPGGRPASVAVGAWYENPLPDLVIADPIGGQIVRMESMGPRVYQVGFPLSILAGHPHDVALGQLDGEGGIDMAIASQTAAKLTVIFNTGNGGESQPLEFPDAGTVLPNRLILDDLEQDGSLDILYTRSGVSGLKVFRGDGSGAFVAQATSYGMEVRGLGGGDFDADGHRDTVLADRAGNALIFVMRLGGEVMDTVTVPLDGSPWSIATGMIDGDAMTDVVVSIEGSNELVVALSGS